MIKLKFSSEQQSFEQDYIEPTFDIKARVFCITLKFQNLHWEVGTVCTCPINNFSLGRLSQKFPYFRLLKNILPIKQQKIHLKEKWKILIKELTVHTQTKNPETLPTETVAQRCFETIKNNLFPEHLQVTASVPTSCLSYLLLKISYSSFPCFTLKYPNRFYVSCQSQNLFHL